MCGAEALAGGCPSALSDVLHRVAGSWTHSCLSPSTWRTRSRPRCRRRQATESHTRDTQATVSPRSLLPVRADRVGGTAILFCSSLSPSRVRAHVVLLDDTLPRRPCSVTARGEDCTEGKDGADVCTDEWAQEYAVRLRRSFIDVRFPRASCFSAVWGPSALARLLAADTRRTVRV